MAAANGTLTPPSLPPAPSSPSIAKRKLADRPAKASNGASTSAQEDGANGSTHALQPALEDILAVLKRYDTCQLFPASTRTWTLIVTTIALVLLRERAYLGPSIRSTPSLHMLTPQ
jgi:hypothetical protein